MALPSACADEIDHEQLSPCPFTDKLPLEIRHCIYRYLLSGSYTKRNLAVKSKEYNVNRESILIGPDHTYNFDISLFGVNKQIRFEAMDFFKRDSSFVSLTHIYGEEQSQNPEYCLERNGVAIIAKNRRAREFPAIGVSIEFDMGWTSADHPAKLPRRDEYVFLLEDLSAACIGLQLMAVNSGRSKIRVALNPHIGNSLAMMRCGYLIPESRLSRCLQTLGQLRGVKHMIVSGHVSSAAYRDTVRAYVANMCTPWDAKEIMGLVEARFREAEKAILNGHLMKALVEYKATNNLVQGNWISHRWPDVKLTGGLFKGLCIDEAFADTEVMLHALIADVYLRLKEHRLARVWVERVFGCLYTISTGDHRHKFPLWFSQHDRAHRALYAELLVVAAQISIVHGHYDEAMAELIEASRLDPSNKGVHRCVKACQESIEVRVKRRHAKRTQQESSKREKSQAALKVVYDRKDKADMAFRDQNLCIARAKYEAAYHKIQMIRDKRGTNVPIEIELEI